MGKDDTPGSKAGNNEKVRQIGHKKTPLPNDRIAGLIHRTHLEDQKVRSESKAKTKTTRNVNKVETPEQEKDVIKIPVLAPRHYNKDLLDEFLDVVFGAAPLAGERILTWSVKPGWSPSYPMEDTTLFSTLGQSAKALYYGTATCELTDKKELRNRKDLFTRLAVVVLDDIGTKVPVDKIPKQAEPTYILETSEGNYQYGYVLSETVTDLPAAEALVQLVYDAGFSDEGGKMATKVVRLPEGVNGKAGAGMGFITRCETMDGPYWAPQDLLDVLDIPVLWTDVLKDAQDTLKRANPRGRGTSPWSDNTCGHVALNGTIDPLLEWLYSIGDVEMDNGEWVTVTCPWNKDHSTGGDIVASYAPVGRGSLPENRGFHCFHDNCKHYTIDDFLIHVAAAGGPAAASYDPVAQLTHEWAYDPVNEFAWHVTAPHALESLPMVGFRGLYPRSIKIVKPDGKEIAAKHSQLWLTSPTRCTVFGQTFDPTTPARIVNIDGKNRVNVYHPPRWPEIKLDEKHVKMFTDFLEYLVPVEDERDFFLDWLAAKANSMAFRGCAILMIAPTYGTGRGTLTDMLAALFSRHNVENISFDKLIGDCTYNDWQEKPLIFTDETLNRGGANKYQVYERLKELIDPRPKLLRINPKYGKQRVSKIHSSYLLCSNHEDALHIPHNDRRIFVIRNVLIPAEASYFSALDEWLNELDSDGEPCWATHVWNWLRARQFELERLLAPPPETEGKSRMLMSGETGMDQILRLALACNPSEYIVPQMVEDVADAMADEMELYDVPNWRKVLRHLIRAETVGVSTSPVPRNGSTTRVRYIVAKTEPDSIPPTENLDRRGRKRMLAKLELFDIDEAISYVKRNLVL